MAKIVLKMGNPGNPIEVDIDDKVLWELFTSTLPSLNARLGRVETRLDMVCIGFLAALGGATTLLATLIAIL